ncbi:hypothetical protein [Streptomyces sp. NPDC047841]|uniref:hypothetical protein n=1 Tax=Streptomyces sp. NPDC047841 TaxID=3154708 RepID=UPI0034561202
MWPTQQTDVLGAAGRPGLRVAYGGEHRAELVDDGLVLGGEGARQGRGRNGESD